jgi:HAD superfamily hydrolase (TIGR01509 family)
VAPPKALLFDFDGLLIETEGPAFRAWQEIYREHGAELSLDRWVVCVGTIDRFDPFEDLEALTGRRVDRQAIALRRLGRKRQLLAKADLRPGVRGYLEEARRLGLKVGIVSSSPGRWIMELLSARSLDQGWDCMLSADGDPSVAKPSPHLYLAALEALGAGADEAVAFEDSPNGIRAAKAAGLYCVAVPNEITASLDLSEADLVVSSLEDMPLSELLRSTPFSPQPRARRRPTTYPAA